MDKLDSHSDLFYRKTKVESQLQNSFYKLKIWMTLIWSHRLGAIQCDFQYFAILLSKFTDIKCISHKIVFTTTIVKLLEWGSFPQTTLSEVHWVWKKLFIFSLLGFVN